MLHCHHGVSTDSLLDLNQDGHDCDASQLESWL